MKFWFAINVLKKYSAPNVSYRNQYIEYYTIEYIVLDFKNLPHSQLFLRKSSYTRTTIKQTIVFKLIYVNYFDF